MAERETKASSYRTIAVMFNMPTLPAHKPESIPGTGRRNRQHGADRTSKDLSRIVEGRGVVVRIPSLGPLVLAADAGRIGKRFGGGHYRLDGEVLLDGGRFGRGGPGRNGCPNYGC